MEKEGYLHDIIVEGCIIIYGESWILIYYILVEKCIIIRRMLDIYYIMWRGALLYREGWIFIILCEGVLYTMKDGN